MGSTTDEFDDDLDEAGADSNLVKDLRKQLRAAKQRDAERDALLNDFLAEKRKSAVSNALKAKGASEAFAKFYTGEDSSEEAVNAWITEHADLFGVGSDEPGGDEQTIEAAGRVAGVLDAAPTRQAGGRREALAAELATTKDKVRYHEIVAELARG